MEKTKTADLYIRVSTDEQAEKGYSIRHQEEQLRKYCENKEITIRNVYKEDFSAKTFNRPEIKKILRTYSSQKNRPELLLFTKWDRFARDIGGAYNMIQKLKDFDIEPQAIEQPLDITIPENQLILAVYLASPMTENLRRGLNVVGGMRRAKKEGRFMGRAPKGYDNVIVDGKKVITPNEDAKIVRWVFSEFSKGEIDLESLRKRAIKKGFECSKPYFYNLIRNPTYCGKIILPAYKKELEEEIDGHFEPLISKELFDNVQNILIGRNRKTGYTICAKPEIPLRGFLNCPKCGSKLTGSCSTGGSGTKHFYYHCKNTCPERTRAIIVNDAFSSKLKEFVFDEAAETLYQKIVGNLFGCNNLEQNQTREKEIVETQKIEARFKNMREKLANDEISSEDYFEFKNDFMPRLKELHSKSMVIEGAESDLKKYLRKGLQLVKDISKVYDFAPLEGKQTIIRSIFKENLVFQNNEVRTGKLNEVLSLVGTFSNGSRRTKKKTEGDLYLQSYEVPYGLGLSNLIDDFQSLRTFMNSRNWKAVF